ncbi:hypothetical protein RF11_13052 [Thelohanellus kitauei]|uniref:Tc1-like transposase DDE domain-containing protein n=1 Tax=Thelohanellus kitauei TaxID=669202 RepID=A0A0C2MRF9_THEKT|nr:hypothetical protein RF11_13052 [Thelohanellus kitauei]
MLCLVFRLNSTSTTTKQVSDEIRKIIIKISKTGQGAQQISEALGCSRHRVHRVVKAYDTEGTISRKNAACIPSKLSDEHKDFIIDQRDVDCYITIKSLKTKLLERFEVNICSSTISKAIGSSNNSFKRVYFVPQRRNTPENIEVRYTYTINLLRYLSGDQHIFPIDETGFTNKKFERCMLNYQNRVVHSETSERPYYREFYAVFLTNLFRTLQLRGTHNGVFVMDNVGFHKCDEIKNLFTLSNHSVLYLPPYSPLVNPLEEAFSKVKQGIVIALYSCDQSREMDCVELKKKDTQEQLAKEYWLKNKRTSDD